MAAAKPENAIARPRPAIAAVEPRRAAAISRLVRVPAVTNATTAAAHNGRSTFSADWKSASKPANLRRFYGYLTSGFIAFGDPEMP